MDPPFQPTHFPDQFRVDLRSIWAHFWVKLGSVCGRFGVGLKSIRGRLVTLLRFGYSYHAYYSHYAYVSPRSLIHIRTLLFPPCAVPASCYRVTTRQSWYYYYYDLGSIQGRFAVGLGPTWSCFGVDLGEPGANLQPACRERRCREREARP